MAYISTHYDTCWKRQWYCILISEKKKLKQQLCVHYLHGERNYDWLTLYCWTNPSIPQSPAVSIETQQ